MAKDPELVELVQRARRRGAGYTINWTQPPPKASEKPSIVSITLFNVAGVRPVPMPPDAAERTLRALLADGY